MTDSNAPAGRAPKVGDRIRMRDEEGNTGVVIRLGRTTGASWTVPPGLPGVAVKWDDGWHNEDLADQDDFYSYAAGEFGNHVIEVDVIE